MENDPKLAKAQSFQDAFGRTNIQLVRKVDDWNAKKQEFEGLDLHDTDLRIPAHSSRRRGADRFFRKLKFQYLEQNAKDKYVKSIVSNIDDAPIALNEQRKQRLKDAKTRLADIQNRIRELAPAVEKDYAHKIIDARLALSRLRQAHPLLTSEELDLELQELDDKKAALLDNVREVKDKVKRGTLRSRRAQDRARRSGEEREGRGGRWRWLPLYDWFTQALSVHRSITHMESLEASADNEIRLTYKVDLASVEVGGLDNTDIDVTEVIDAHVPSNDAPGVIAAILARVRNDA
ncbi:hypothetical protein BDZ89DRAFT_1061438 [Hymenopellis radicata]|nr:hypothetical protein BDZ89DRAFT_1061438 [Hymenopellis radicata]